jgi:Family of unknown function (DUF6350)
MSALLHGAKPAQRDGANSGRGSPSRPLIVTGAVAAACAAASGLAVLITLVLIGWIAAPHAALGSGLPGVFRTASQLWLVAHHVGFSLRGVGRAAGHGAAGSGAGRIGMLPLGLVVLPGALLYRAGRWVVRTGEVVRLRHVGYGAVALAAPYSLLAAALAMIGRTTLATPSLWEAMVAAFLLAFAAGGLGGARALAPWRNLLRLLPERPRSLVTGTLGILAVLTAAGAALAAGSLAAHIGTFRSLTSALDPGLVGAVLLLLIELAFVPNAIIWAISYLLGPGFAFGYGTVVAPTGTALGGLPMFPMLAALPSGGGAGQTATPAWVSLGVLATPYLAGVFGGLLIVRVGPTPRVEAAPLWGFACGAATGLVAGALAAFAGGPLGGVRLTAIGPSGWQVWLVTTLEVGVAAAAAAGIANWFAAGRGGIEDLPPAGDAPPGEPAPEIVAMPRDDSHHIYMDPWAAEDGDEPEE